MANSDTTRRYPQQCETLSKCHWPECQCEDTGERLAVALSDYMLVEFGRRPTQGEMEEIYRSAYKVMEEAVEENQHANEQTTGNEWWALSLNDGPLLALASEREAIENWLEAEYVCGWSAIVYRPEENQHG